PLRDHDDRSGDRPAVEGAAAHAGELQAPRGWRRLRTQLQPSGRGHDSAGRSRGDRHVIMALPDVNIGETARTTCDYSDLSAWSTSTRDALIAGNTEART